MASDAYIAEHTNYTISVLLCGYRPPADDLDEPPCHVGIAVHVTTAHPQTCHLHHIRSPIGTRYVYEPRPSQPLASDPTVWGRCELRNTLSAAEAGLANRVLADFGANRNNIPEWEEGNCQDWMAGGVQALERFGLVKKGDGEWWRNMVGRSRNDMEMQWKEDGRRWVEGAKRLEGPPAVIDARWADKDIVTVGKLCPHKMFSDQLGALQHQMMDRRT